MRMLQENVKGILNHGKLHCHSSLPQPSATNVVMNDLLLANLY